MRTRKDTISMATYVDLDGVKTWYDEQGSGDPLVLLHPGMADARAWEPNLEALASKFHTYLPERRGHGHTPDVDGPYSYELVADDTIKFIETVIGGPVKLAGCSDGAAVALMVALRRPDLVRQLACVAGVFHHQGWVPEAIDPSIEQPGFMATSWAEVSPHDIGYFPVVLAKLHEMHVGLTLTAEDLKTVVCRSLVMVGDDDEVTLEHAIEFYRGMPDSELAIVPGTSHGLLVEKPDLCNRILVDFFTLDAVQTYAPIRRA